MSTMPAAFIGHGSPMNTLEDNIYTDAWSAFAASFEKPTAVLAISAHWYINATVVTSMATPRVIHDFYGFPQELVDFDYPAPGDQRLAAHVGDVVDPVWVGLDDETWGIDHGTWSVLARIYPTLTSWSCSWRSMPPNPSSITSIWGPVWRPARRGSLHLRQR